MHGMNNIFYVFTNYAFEIMSSLRRSYEYIDCFEGLKKITVLLNQARVRFFDRYLLVEVSK
jgi:hypothetical protein